MSFEVSRSSVTDGQADASAARLAAMGAPRRATQSTQEDAYLSHPSRDFAATNRVSHPRVGDANAVTYKGPKHAGPTKTREEIEVPFAAAPRLRPDGAGCSSRWASGPARRPQDANAVPPDLRGPPVEVVTRRRRGFGTFVEVETIAQGEADLPRRPAGRYRAGRRAGPRPRSSPGRTSGWRWRSGPDGPTGRTRPESVWPDPEIDLV